VFPTNSTVYSVLPSQKRCSSQCGLAFKTSMLLSRELALASCWEQFTRSSVRHLHLFCCVFLTKVLAVDQEPGEFLSRVLKQATRLDCLPRILKIAPSITEATLAAAPTDLCPACREPIVVYELGGARCARGHIWGRFTVTPAHPWLISSPSFHAH